MSPNATSDRIPSLDGLRAVAILLVVAGHLRTSESAPPILQSVLDATWSLRPGNLGVRIFFVLSGYLITTLLLSEQARRGRISLWHFYFRRTFRIMPAFYTFLLCMWAASLFGMVELPAFALISAATYTTNYVGSVWSVGHAWSLAVEEQFYLIWPGLLVLAGLGGGFRGAALMLLCAPLFRVAALMGGWSMDPTRSFECVADALATGCLLAAYRDRLWSYPGYRRLMQSWLMYGWPVGLLVLASVLTRTSPLVDAAIGVTLLNLSIAVLVDWLIRTPGSLVGMALNSRPIVFVGVISYSLYLWQQPFLGVRSGPAFPLNLVLIFVAALASYFLVERPTLALRSRIERRFKRNKTGGTLSPALSGPLAPAGSAAPFVGSGQHSDGPR